MGLAAIGVNFASWWRWPPDDFHSRSLVGIIVLVLLASLHVGRALHAWFPKFGASRKPQSELADKDVEPAWIKEEQQSSKHCEENSITHESTESVAAENPVSAESLGATYTQKIESISKKLEEREKRRQEIEAELAKLSPIYDELLKQSGEERPKRTLWDKVRNKREPVEQKQAVAVEDQEIAEKEEQVLKRVPDLIKELDKMKAAGEVESAKLKGIQTKLEMLNGRRATPRHAGKQDNPGEGTLYSALPRTPPAESAHQSQEGDSSHRQSEEI